MPPVDELASHFPLSTVWSNFEIGDLNFWRSDAYMAFFEHLDSTGGFYYERWVSLLCPLSAREEQS